MTWAGWSCPEAVSLSPSSKKGQRRTLSPNQERHFSDPCSSLWGFDAGFLEVTLLDEQKIPHRYSFLFCLTLYLYNYVYKFCGFTWHYVCRVALFVGVLIIKYLALTRTDTRTKYLGTINKCQSHVNFSDVFINGSLLYTLPFSFTVTNTIKKSEKETHSTEWSATREGQTSTRGSDTS